MVTARFLRSQVYADSKKSSWEDLQKTINEYNRELNLQPRWKTSRSEEKKNGEEEKEEIAVKGKNASSDCISSTKSDTKIDKRKNSTNEAKENSNNLDLSYLSEDSDIIFDPEGRPTSKEQTLRNLGLVDQTKDFAKFDLLNFLSLIHPLNVNADNMLLNIDRLEKLHMVLKKLHQHMIEQSASPLWSVIRCDNPHSVPVVQVFDWLIGLTKSITFKEKKKKELKVKHDKSLQDLVDFLGVLNPDTINRLVDFVDVDGDGEIDMWELDNAFRLSRWKVEDPLLGTEDELVQESTDEMTVSSSKKSSKYGLSVITESGESGSFASSSSLHSPLVKLDTKLDDDDFDELDDPVIILEKKRQRSSLHLDRLVKGANAVKKYVRPNDPEFFLEIDAENAVKSFAVDNFGMLDIKDVNRVIKEFEKADVSALVDENWYEMKLFYLEAIRECLLKHHPKSPISFNDWVVVTFGSGVNALLLTSFRLELMLLLEPLKKNDLYFFREHYILFEEWLTKESNLKGAISVEKLDILLNNLDSSIHAFEDTVHIRTKYAITRIERAVKARFNVPVIDYIKMLDGNRTGRIHAEKLLLPALIKFAKSPLPSERQLQVFKERQAKLAKIENQKKEKERAFQVKLAAMTRLGVTEVLRKFEAFMRSKGMRLQDLFNIIDEDHSGRITREELFESLLNFVKTEEHPQRTKDKELANENRRKEKQMRWKIERERRAFAKRMAEVEKIGAHNAIIKIDKMMRRFQRTFEFLFKKKKGIIDVELIHKQFRGARLSWDDIDRLQDYLGGKIRVEDLKTLCTDYMRYAVSPVYKNLAVEREDDSLQPLLSYDEILTLLRFFYWDIHGVNFLERPAAVDEDGDIMYLDWDDEEVLLNHRISLVEFQAALDSCSFRNMISYAKTYRMKKFYPHLFAKQQIYGSMGCLPGDEVSDGSSLATGSQI